MTDTRPLNCRFRLQDEGKAYPRSGCQACGLNLGVGNICPKQFGVRPDFSHQPDVAGPGGMSLRDWFAGQALANSDICRRDDAFPQRTAYNFADAMMDARKRDDDD